MECVDEAGNVIGTLTSGTFSPTLGTGIGLALVDASYKPGGRVGVRVRSRVEEFSIEKAPLINPQVRQA